MNAGDVDKACKSNGRSNTAVANGLVTRRYKPSTRAQPGEIRANSRWSRKGKDLSVEDWSASYQLVGEVMAHQGYDG